MATDEERLAAQAEGGQAGLAAFDKAASEIANRRTETIQGAMAESANRAAGAAADQAIQNIINRPVDRRLDDISQAKGTFDADMARLANAQSTYMAGAQRFGSRASAQAAERAAASARQRALEDEFNSRYGGYQTAGEYDNAVEGGARALQGERVSQQAAKVKESASKAASAAQANNYVTSLLNRGRQGRADNATAQRKANPTAGEVAAQQRLGAASAANAYLRSIAPRYGVSDIGRPRQVSLAPVPELRAPAPARVELPSQRDRELVQQLAALRQQRSESSALNRLYMGQLQSPQALQDMRYEFATDFLGADPLEAGGRFAPMSDLEAMQAQMEEAELAQQLADFNIYGPQGADAAREQAVAQATGGLDVQQIAQGANATPDAVANVVTSEGFDAALAAAAGGDLAVIEEIIQSDPVAGAIFTQILRMLYPDAS